MTVDTIEYKGFDIEIVLDEVPTNPFTYIDGLPCILVAGDRYTASYNDDENYVKYLPDLTREEIKNNRSDIKRLLSYGSMITFWDKVGRYDYSNCEDFTEVVNTFLQERYEEERGSSKWELLEEILGMKGINCYKTTLRGYVQSAWCDVIAIGDDTDEYLSSACKLYGDWAFGDVYGYRIEELEESCYGFYGIDHVESGLLEYAKNAIDSHISYTRKRRLNKVKELIKNHVPLGMRPTILASL